MDIEVVVPDDWTVGQTFAAQQLLQYAVRDAHLVFALVRKEVTPDQLHTTGLKYGSHASFPMSRNCSLSAGNSSTDTDTADLFTSPQESPNS